MTRIDVIAEMQLTAADDAAIADLLHDALDEDFGGRSYHMQRHHLRIVARDADAVIGHIALLMREIRLGDRLTPVIGVAEVVTRADRRGQGIAGAMLTEAISQARGSMARFMVLFGDRPIYAGHGFHQAQNVLTWTTLDDVRSAGIRTGVDAGLMVLPLRDEVWDDAAPVDLVGHMF